MCVIKELEGMPSRIWAHVGDLDVSASYPYGELANNTCKETTLRELTDIEGVPEALYRLENMGITAGHVNSVPWCTNMLNFPSHEEVLKAYLADHPEATLKVSFEQAKEDMHQGAAERFSTPLMR